MAAEQTGPAPSATFETGQKQAADWLADNWDPGLTVRAWWALLAESGWGFPQFPTEWFGQGLPTDAAGRRQGPLPGNRRPRPARQPGPAAGRAHAARARQRGAQVALPAHPHPRRRGLVPVLLRARLRVGPGQ